MRLLNVCFFCFICVLLLTTPASAGVALYDNGPINGRIDAWNINAGVADSFTLAANSTITGVQFGSWVFAGDTPIAVDWSISASDPFYGSTFLAYGIADLANTLQFGGVWSGQYDVYTSSFSTGNVQLDAGTYWLLLWDATTKHGSGYPVYWDQNGGLSLADQGGMRIPSESFQILGTPGTATPEPSSLALFGSGILLLAGALRRKLSR
jgi:hypothetical protein